MNGEPIDRLRAALADRYRIERPLGAGGMATVYLARDLRHRRAVAIKVLRPTLAAVLGAERFLREIEITAGLSHPHIVPLYDSGEVDGILFHVMPYVEGESLRDRLRREQQLPIADAIAVAVDVAGALAWAHARGVIHRDIKPENILLADGRALVTDFGIARAVAEAGSDRLTQSGVSLGTPAYMSPEQMTGGPEPDGRSDLYSLACVTYEMLVGEPPFAGSSRVLSARRLVETPRPMRAVRETIGPALDAVVARALSRLPADRQASPAVFAAELRAAASGGPHRRPRWRVPVLAAAAVIVLVGGVLLQQRVRPGGGAGAATHRLAVLPLENLGGPEDAPFADGMTDEIMGRLSEVGGIQVVSRTSARRFRGTALSMREVGAELNADYVLEGSVRTERGSAGADMVLVTPRLIRVADDVPVWQQRFDAPLRPGGILRLQADIAIQVASALDVRLGAAERRRVNRVTTEDSAAYRSYQLGRFQWAKRDAASLSRAIEHFREAIARDSSFADAYAGLSDALGASALLYGDSSVRERGRLALEAARRAVALDSGLAAAHASLGFGRLFFEWSWDGAEEALRRAIALDPGYGPARYWYTQALWIRGRYQEALQQSLAAVESDPLSAVARLARARTYRLLAREAEWVVDLRQVTELQEGLFVSWLDLAEYHAARGDSDSVRVACRRFLDLRYGPGRARDETVLALADVFVRDGEVSRALALSARDGLPEWPALAARLYALRGGGDSAFARLARMETSRDPELVTVVPFLEPLLGRDPRWAALRSRLQYPP